MSSEFSCEQMGEWEDGNFWFVRWGRGKGKQCGYEFGTRKNFESCKAMAEMGFTFYSPYGSIDPEEGTPKWFSKIESSGQATFGEFGMTVAVMSEDHFRFTEE